MYFAYGETVVRVRSTPGGVDKYGDPVTGTTTRTDIEKCAVYKGVIEEPVGRGRDPVSVDYTILAPSGTDVVSTDLIEVRGQTCTVVGDGFEWANPITGWRPGVEIRANVFRG
jgi:hypothetical protein